MRILPCLVGAMLCAGGSEAASLRQFRLVEHGMVRLSDLFDGIARESDRVLGPAPQPGTRLTVQAPQLAAIARDYDVAWRPQSGAEHCVLERAGVPFTQDDAEAALRPALRDAGVADDWAIMLADYQAPLLPPDASLTHSVSQVDYSASDNHFTAVLSIQAGEAPPVEMRVAGEAVPMVEAALLVRRLRAGAVLGPQDVRAARVPLASLHGETAVAADSVAGLAVRHDMAASAALTGADLVKPVLVSRHDAVRMVLNAGSLALEATGLALEEGALGAHVRVENPSSHTVVLAEVTGAGEVRVMPGRAIAVTLAAP